MNPISRIAPVTDAEAARMVRRDTLADLAEQITAMPVEAAAGAAHPAGRTFRQAAVRRWRLMIGIPAAAALAVAALVITSLGGPGPGPAGPAHAQALSFTRHGRYIDVIIRNPLADPSRYRAEFAQHHLDITLKLVPVPSPLVGTVIVDYSGGGTMPITATGCRNRSGDCPELGLKIPVGFRGPATIEFGRAARPGEHYVVGALATAPGEPLHGVRYLCRTLPTVLAMLRQRQVTVAVIRYAAANGKLINGGKLVVGGRVFPGTWYVNEATMWAPRQVMLWVGPACTPGLPGGGETPGTGPSSAPSPSPTA